MKAWARSCPDNYLHKLHLLQAEAARVEGRPYEKVMRLYQQATSGARAHGYQQDAALAQELAGRHAMTLGFEEAGRAHLTEAMALYLQWGARAVARWSGRVAPCGRRRGARCSRPAAVDPQGLRPRDPLTAASVQVAAGPSHAAASPTSS